MSLTLCVGTVDHVRSAADVLDDAGIPATVVPDGETARRRVRSEAVGCVVTALELPEQSGAELARRLDAAPTIVCAADGDERVAGQVLADGADGYVPAEAVDSLLVAQVRAALDDGDDETATRNGQTAERNEVTPERIDEPGKRTTETSELNDETDGRSDETNGRSDETNGRSDETNGRSDEADGHSDETARGIDAPGSGDGVATSARPSDADHATTASDSAESPAAADWNTLFGAATSSSASGLDADDVAAFVGGDGAFVATDGPVDDEQPAPDQIRRAQTLEALRWATEDSFDGEDETAVADEIAAAADRTLGVEFAGVYLPAAASDAYEPVAARGACTDELPAVDVPVADDGATSHARTSPGDTDDGFAPATDASDDVPTDSVEWFPIGDRGLLCVGRDVTDGIDGWTEKLASLLASTGNAALDRAERKRQLQRTAAVVEAVGDGVVAIDDANRISDVDDTFAGVTGYSRDRLVGERLSLIAGRETVERIEACLRELRSEGAPNRRSVTMELQTRWTDGIPCELTLSSVPASETDTRVVGFLRDVSQRERLEAQIEAHETSIAQVHATALTLESARSTDHVYEAAVTGACETLDADRCWLLEREATTYEVRSACGREESGGSSADLAVERLADRLADRALEAGQTRIEEQFEAPAGGSVDTAGIDVVDPETDADGPTAESRTGGSSRGKRTPEPSAGDGTDSWGAASQTDEGIQDQYRSGLAVPIDESTALQVVAHEPAAFGDVERELAELLVAHVASTLERLRHEDDLRSQRDRIAALFDNVPNPIVRTRIENDVAIVEAVNPAFERVFGYDTDEIVGKVLDEHIVPPDRLNRAQELTQRGLDGEIVETEVRRLTDSGTRDFLLTVVPIEDGEGNGVNYAVYTDITERKQRQQRLEVLNRVLRHDLRNGMNVVKGSAELLQEHVKGDAGEHVDAIDRRAAEMIDLADKTRTVQRTLETNPGDVGPVDVVDAVEQAIDELDADVPGTEIETSLPAEATARVGKLLPVAVRHVLENAIVHNDGEPFVEVSVRELDADHTVEVVVADDGPGIPDAERMLVTEQREITQLRHGSGLGLWIVNWVVTGSGGDLAIEYNEPRGTVVRMELPQAAADRCNLPVLLD